MRIIEKKGPFTTVEILLETVADDEVRTLMQTSGRVSLLSYEPRSMPSGFHVQRKQTPLILLRGSLDETVALFRDTVRNEIRRTQRLEGLKIALPDSDEDAHDRLYERFELAQGRAPYAPSYTHRYLCLGAWYNGELVSGIRFYQEGPFLRVWAIYSQRMETRSEMEREKYKVIGFATKRLIYELCRYGFERGATQVDLASVNLTEASKASIAQFKMGFGGLLGEEFRYTYVAPLFRVFQHMAAWRAKVWARFRLCVSHV